MFIYILVQADKNRAVEIPRTLIDFQVRAEFRHIPLFVS